MASAKSLEIAVPKGEQSDASHAGSGNVRHAHADEVNGHIELITDIGLNHPIIPTSRPASRSIKKLVARELQRQVLATPAPLQHCVIVRAYCSRL